MRIAVKIVFLIIILSSVLAQAQTQIRLPNLSDSLFSTYYQQRVSHFKLLPATKNDIVFIGNSITDGAEWSELFADINIKNRGISGDISAGVLHRIGDIGKQKPKKVFLLIGVNDLAKGISTDSIVKNILLVASWIKQESPSSKLFIQSILPVSDRFKKFEGHTNKTDSILKVNSKLNSFASGYGYTFINLFPFFINQQGKLNEKFTNDGLHLLGEGYLLWKHIVFPYVYDLQAKPSLIPLPQQLTWNNGFFPLYKCHSIMVTDNALMKEAEKLKAIFTEKGLQTSISNKAGKDETDIELRLNAQVPGMTDEGYAMNVSENKILLTAKTTHGIFNGIQTLRQLMRDGAMIDACDITDHPTFSWRGYMIDVGRNYMSMKFLKEQIDVMAMYKMNVFHFHATEDIAWRLASKQYPQLTAPENMLRNKGMYYTETEIKELITFCKERYITFVPEIDMPGHSAAFKRAMKTDMQSDSGMLMVKNILKEFCATYDVPFIHIGADEVKITSKNFVPEMTACIESLGRKVIGWQPGGNFTGSTIRQLWMDDNAHHASGNEVQYIDSRHLYLNHMDPLEAVTTIFNRRIADKEKGDATTLGGTICMWPDRAVGKEEDVLQMNPVYPGVLAFAERCWRGGGRSGWVANIDDGDKKQFIDFEGRLLENKKIYFNDKIFNYVKQSDIVWKLYGPYDNGGDLAKQFLPETKKGDKANSKFYKEVTGGTIVLRHWWAPLIKGAIENPKDSTTWYATTSIWADEDGVKNFWIGFNNISRSPATDSPPLDGWDTKNSAVWVNGKLIASPVWLRGGQKGNSEIPLNDEGYEYRSPTKIYLRKGWNDVLIKAPIGSFKGKDWQNPVKWMFTFVEIN
ncbi:family 20 glycosylhydrolase [Pinibacter aurantiacus]|uniref:beta-N-acetylhexosaminidase n=1 Tax=Pinibacter aurantiacus TaxID=2851599 RepID=A0A9E2S9P7_9BACT|nr:family 20 glycosylhydrolase [Pinibacter aurantiacus]MBV4355930.1 family 20 glycosylhydrolase [Pinibacter aurantiacus]